MFKHAAKTIMPALVASPLYASVPRTLPKAARLRTCAVTYQMPCVEQKVEQARSEHLVEQAMNKLKERRHAITTVESCTGGMLANLLTNVGGAAEVYWGSVVTYDGSLKSDWGVPAGSIKEVGTVTEQVASEMAGAGLHRMMKGYEKEKSCSDLNKPTRFVCVSTTGFAGGAPKPEYSGTCYLGMAMSGWSEPIVKKVHADGDSREHRVAHKEYFAEQAIQMVLDHLDD